MTKSKVLWYAGGLGLGLVVIGVCVLTFGFVRYGGPEGIIQRVESRLSISAPHDDFVPTPLAPESSAVEAALLTAWETPVAAAPLAAAAIPSTMPAAGVGRPAVRGTSSHGRLARLGSEVLQDVAPTLTATPLPTPTPAATPTPSLPPAHRLEGIAHYWQTWNNCGPATLAMNLSYYRVGVTQEQVRLALRPEKDDKNVSPEEMAVYARSQGLQAVARVNGDSRVLRKLLLAGVPVLVETWYEPKPNDGMGHYRLLIGYEDAAREWIAFDSYESRGLDRKAPYSGIRMNYSDFDKLWMVFGRAYVVVYDEGHAQQVKDIIGPDLDNDLMWQRALATAQAAARANTKNAFAWFNIGTALTAQGDYANAAATYDQARRLKLPWRMLWYQFGPFRAYYETGRYDEVIALADATISTAKNVEELYYWKGMAQKAKGDAPSARASFEKALQLQPGYGDAQAALAELQ